MVQSGVLIRFVFCVWGVFFSGVFSVMFSGDRSTLFSVVRIALEFETLTRNFAFPSWLLFRSACRHSLAPAVRTPMFY